MAQWYRLLGLKNRLVRREQELMVGSKQLELEDRAEGLEEQLGRGLGQAEEQVGAEGERERERENSGRRKGSGENWMVAVKAGRGVSGRMKKGGGDAGRLWWLS